MATGSTKKKKNSNSSPKADTDEAVAPPQRKSLSPPQISFLLFAYVMISCAAHIQSSVRKGTVCAEYFGVDNAVSETPCEESDLFFLEQFRQAIVGTVGFVVAMTLLCWQDSPLHQRMNLFLAQGLGLTLFILVTQGHAMASKLRIRLFLSISAVAGTIFLGTRSGIQISRPLQKSSPANIWIFLITSVASSGLLLFLIRGASTYVNTFETITAGGKLLFHLTLAQHCIRWVVIPIFAVFYLDRNRKTAVLLFVALANIYQFLSLSNNKSNVRYFDAIALFLLSTAILSINVAFLPEGMFAAKQTPPKKQTSGTERRPKTKKA